MHTNAPPEVPPELLAELRSLILSGHSVAAIKRYKEFAGCGLKQAKDWTERLIDQVMSESRRT